MRTQSHYHLTCECGHHIATHEEVTVCLHCGRLIQIEFRLCPCGKPASEKSLYCHACQVPTETGAVGPAESVMRWLRSRTVLAAAYAWKRERVGQLQAEILIHETLLATARQELAELRQFEGRNLALVYGSWAVADVETVMRGQREFMEACEDLWIAGERSLKPKEAA